MTFTATTFREEGGWVAQCLEVDVAAQGESAAEATAELIHNLADLPPPTHAQLEPYESCPTCSDTPGAQPPDCPECHGAGAIVPEADAERLRELDQQHDPNVAADTMRRV